MMLFFYYFTAHIKETLFDQLIMQEYNGLVYFSDFADQSKHISMQNTQFDPLHCFSFIQDCLRFTNK